MRELIPRDQYGVFADIHDTSRVDSLFVARAFEKRHDNVLQDIAKIIGSDSGVSAEFNFLNFQEISYKDSKGRKQRAYAMPRDGFLLWGIPARKRCNSRNCISDVSTRWRASSKRWFLRGRSFLC